MTEIWMVSFLLLWLIVIVLVLAVFTLARQIGMLHRRLSPTGARMTNAGPEIGTLAPEIERVGLYGKIVRIGGRGKRNLVAFISLTCPTCEGLVPALRSIWKSERASTNVVLVGLTGDQSSNREFASRHKLDNIQYIVSPEVGLQYHVTSPPYCVLIDQQGIVRAKGIVNRREHLESLLNAAELGYPTKESLMEARHRLAAISPQLE